MTKSEAIAKRIAPPAPESTAEVRTVRLYENGGGGLFIHLVTGRVPTAADPVYDGVESGQRGQFAQDARAIIDGDTDGWTVGRLTYGEMASELEALPIIASYSRDTDADMLCLDRNAGTGTYRAGGSGRHYLGLESWE